MKYGSMKEFYSDFPTYNLYFNNGFTLNCGDSYLSAIIVWSKTQQIFICVVIFDILQVYDNMMSYFINGTSVGISARGTYNLVGAVRDANGMVKLGQAANGKYTYSLPYIDESMCICSHSCIHIHAHANTHTCIYVYLHMDAHLTLQVQTSL